MTENTNLAYASLLAGGLLILVGGVGAALMMDAWSGMMNDGMMGGYASYMTTNWFAGMAWWMGLIGLATGAIVLYAAYRTRQPNADRTTTGTLAIVAGTLSLLAMGGWVLGAVLAVVGGALAISKTSEDPTRSARGV